MTAFSDNFNVAKMVKFSVIVLKTLWEEEKMLVTSIFSSSHNVFRRLFFRVIKRSKSRHSNQCFQFPRKKAFKTDGEKKDIAYDICCALVYPKRNETGAQIMGFLNEKPCEKGGNQKIIFSFSHDV